MSVFCSDGSGVFGGRTGEGGLFVVLWLADIGDGGFAVSEIKIKGS